MPLFRLLFFVLLFSAACRDAGQSSGPLSREAMLAKSGDSSRVTSIQWLDSTNRDFGKIPEGQKLDVSFRFRNTGDQPLIIEKVEPSCGCTIAEQPTEPILNGKEGVIKATFSSEGRIGPNHKTLFVYANTKGTRSHELQFQVEVEKKKW
jgi:hypothetical protein